MSEAGEGSDRVKMKNIQYLDGSEKFLAELFSKGNERKIRVQIGKILADQPAWEILYHLSPQRHFLLNWYDFKSNGSLLEVGAGCGAVTGLFLQRLKEVYANELEENRMEILKARHNNCQNLVAVPGSIDKIKLAKKFDYVSLIGVLEYAGKFFLKGQGFRSPFVRLLKCVASYLKSDGILLLAIENKIGIKYLAGHKEDHLGIPFASIDNFPDYSGIRTFSKPELTSLLHEAGFEPIRYFYPYPDYKLPRSILTDEAYQTNISTSSYAFTPQLQGPQYPVLDEVQLSDEIRKSAEPGMFANSFLVEARLI